MVSRMEQSGRHSRFTTFSVRDLCEAGFEIDWLVEQVIPRGQPGMIVGPEKSGKTSIMLDLAVSLASGTRFLGIAEVKEPVNVLVFSAESGREVIGGKLNAICRGRGIRFEDLQGKFVLVTDVPQFASDDDLEDLETEIRRHSSEVVVIDPAYFATGGTDPNNLVAQGALLRRVNRICERNGATLVIVHHTRKAGKDEKFRGGSGFTELADSSNTGYQQWARWWILIKRAKSYKFDSVNTTTVNVGGSAGHSSRWAVAIYEGTPDDREWSCTTVPVQSSEQVREQSDEQSRHDDRVDRVMECIVASRKPMNQTEIAKALRMNNGLAKACIDARLRRGASSLPVVARAKDTTW